MIARQVEIKRFEIPEGWSIESAHFINQCLQRNQKSRLGATGGTEELKQHAWFKSFDWEQLACKRMQSPFVPDISNDNFDQNHVNNPEWKDADVVKEAESELRRDSIQKLFESYYYNKNDVKAPIVRPSLTQSTRAATNATKENVSHEQSDDDDD